MPDSFIGFWLAVAFMVANGVMVLAMILTFAAALLDPFFATGRTWFWKRGGLGS